MQDASAGPTGRRGIAGVPTLAALAHRPYRLIWSGLVITNIAFWAQAFAQGWLMVEIALAEGNPHLAPFYLGLLNLAIGVPNVVLGLYAGVLTDRVDRRLLLAACQVASLFAALALALYTIFAVPTVLGLALLAGLNACAQAFDGTPRQAMLPRLVPPRDLMSAVGLNQIAWHASALVGPLLGGLLIGPIGAGGLFLLKALSQLPILAACLAVDPQPPEPGAGRAGNPFSAIGEALRFLFADGVLRWSMILLLGIAVLIRPYQGLMPSLVYDLFGGGAQELAWLMGAAGLGSLVGALLIAPAGGLRRSGRVLGGACAAAAALLVVFTFQRSLLAGLAVLVAVGATNLLAVGIASGFLQTRSTDALRGRVMGLQIVFLTGLNPLGVMAIGSLATFIGVAGAVAAAGALSLLVALLALTATPALRELGGARYGRGVRHAA